MTVRTDRQTRERLVAKALDSVTAASKSCAALGAGPDCARSTHYLEASIRSAVAYGYPVEVVADAASMSVAEVTSIAHRSMAA